jgi:internalin A
MSRLRNPRTTVEEVIQEARANDLSELDLSEFGMAQLPGSFDQLGELQELNLSNNRLTTLPESVGQLSHLRSLVISDNQLTALPESVGQLSQLQELNLSNNRLTALPKSVGQLSRLELLNLSDNQLTALPKSVGQLSQLESLDLSKNSLTDLSDSVGQLSQLESLNLSNNRLTALPKSVGQLSRLRSLNLSDNQLTVLPESVGQLSQLESLNLSNNRLTALPKSLRTIISLRQLYLHGNGVLKLPPEVLGPTRQQALDRKTSPGEPVEILDFYFRTRNGWRPLNEAKLILVGRGNVGKTSLLKRLLFDSFDKDEKKTEGILIEPWDLLLNGNEHVKLHVWDFGGQEIMHATHQFFLTQRSVYLLVLNGRDGLEAADADYWLKLIESLGAESPVIIVLNKIKEHPFDLNRRGLQQKFPAVREFVRTDCELRIGIDELRAVIERETDRLEYLRVPFPTSWFAIKDRLAGMKKNYLAFEQYQALCARDGEKDSKGQQLLAAHLHRLGIALNYSEDPRLRDTHVLNPQWVTSGIYTILNARRLAEQKGVLRVTDLNAIIDTQVYPRKMHIFLLDLMRKFELCFHFPDDEGRHLIPELLDVEEPKATQEFRPEACLSFQYHYPILPEGLLPRFIVRTHVLSEGLPRWRTGVILKFEGQRALVKADVADKKVVIFVSGPIGGRRRLLAIIRSDFERIHASIEKLKPEEMVPVPGRPNFVIPYRKLTVLEAKGKIIIEEVFDDVFIELSVQELLTGVDIERVRKWTKWTSATKKDTGPVRLFYSYSHKDERLRNRLETHLTLLQRERRISTWHDRDINAGEDWKQRIDENLETADIILLLVSADFIASDYCYEKEMKRALERHDAREARVIPVILRDVDWQAAPFARLQALPKGGRAVTKWLDKDSAWRSIAEGIAKVVEEIRPTGP